MLNTKTNQLAKDLADAINAAYNARNFAVSCKWKDGSTHDLIVRESDGLTAAVGWIGSSTYPTVLNLRGRTVKVVNSSGTSTLSDERMKKDWRGLDGYDGFFDALCGGVGAGQAPLAGDPDGGPGDPGGGESKGRGRGGICK